MRGVLDGPPRPDKVLDPCEPGPPGTDLTVEDGCVYLTAVAVPTTGLLAVEPAGEGEVRVEIDEAGRQSLDGLLQGPLANGPEPRVAFVSDDRVLLTVSMGRNGLDGTEFVVEYENPEVTEFNQYMLDASLTIAPLRLVTP